MAKIELRHLDCTGSKNYGIVSIIKLYSKEVIKLDIYDCKKREITPLILDKSTAIRLAKTLRTEINKIREEGSNG